MSQGWMIVERQCDECPWEGNVEVEVRANGVEIWDCPLCHFRHEDEVPEDDASSWDPEDRS